jgi:hypothetical protein
MTTQQLSYYGSHVFFVSFTPISCRSQFVTWHVTLFAWLWWQNDEFSCPLKLLSYLYTNLHANPLHCSLRVDVSTFDLMISTWTQVTFLLVIWMLETLYSILGKALQWGLSGDWKWPTIFVSINPNLQWPCACHAMLSLIWSTVHSNELGIFISLFLLRVLESIRIIC